MTKRFGSEYALPHNDVPKGVDMFVQWGGPKGRRSKLGLERAQGNG